MMRVGHIEQPHECSLPTHGGVYKGQKFFFFNVGDVFQCDDENCSRYWEARVLSYRSWEMEWRGLGKREVKRLKKLGVLTDEIEEPTQ